MDTLSLSLRQRQLIHFLQLRTTYTTGEELAEHLHVSSRTIRHDIIEINDSLKNTSICILSKRRWGYLLKADCEKELKQLLHMTTSFLSKEERVRHLAFRLCLAESNLNLYDFEEEMFVSRTTLEHDLKELRASFTQKDPYIKLIRNKTFISFEENERKKRYILNHLLSDHWNYSSTGTMYSENFYLDAKILRLIIQETNYYLAKYHIIVEDINMIKLNLAIAIMYYRIISNHPVTEKMELTYVDSEILHPANCLLNSLEKKLNCSFGTEDRKDIYLIISCARLLDAKKLTFKTVDQYFDPSILKLTDAYIKQIQQNFHIDFSANEDFYITILQHFRYLSLPLYYFNEISLQVNAVRSNILIELEIAYSVQELAHSYYQRYLNETEILYLAFCIAGALRYYNYTVPKQKTVVMCHLNLPSIWDLKYRILDKFKDYLEITELLPIHMKDTFDFSDTDLILNTSGKEITNDTDCHCISISPFFTIEDQNNVNTHIINQQIHQFYDDSLPSSLDLLENGCWHERIDTQDWKYIIELLFSDFSENRYVSENYLADVLQRESILSFSLQPSVTIAYSMKASSKTVLSIATLEHRIKINSHKTRIIILAAFRLEERTMLFRLINELLYSGANLNDSRFLKTKEEFLDFFERNLE